MVGLLAFAVSLAPRIAWAQMDAQFCINVCMSKGLEVNSPKFGECMAQECGGGEPPANKKSSSKTGDFSALYGEWQGKHTACGAISDDTWSIDASGASAFETTCTVKSAKRSGKVYTLKQRCEYFEGDAETRTFKFKLLSTREMETGGTRYIRCR